MTIREECFPGTAFAGCTGYPFPTLSFRAQREIFFVTSFASSFTKPFIGSTAYRLSAIRCFPFLAVGRAPSYRQRKRSLGFARDDDTGRTHFPHTLCMIQRISIPYTVISSAARNLPCTPSFLAPFAKGFPFSAVSHRALYQCAGKIEGFARDDDTGIAFYKHIRCTLRGINPFPPIPSFRAQREIFLALRRSLLLSLKVSPFPLSHIERYTSVQERSRASLGMTIRE